MEGPALGRCLLVQLQIALLVDRLRRRVDHLIVHSDPGRRRHGHALRTIVIVDVSSLLVHLRLVV